MVSSDTTDIAAALALAETWNGLAVASITVRLRNGRTVTVDVPAPAEDDEDGRRPDDVPLTNMESAVLAAVDEMPTGIIWTYQQIANRAGYANSGHLRKFLKSLPNVKTTPNGIEKLPAPCPK